MNINDYVKVKLTETGKKLLQGYIADFNNNMIENYYHSTFKLSMPIMNDDNLETQLWVLLSYFPNNIYTLGCEPPFTEIEFIKK